MSETIDPIQLLKDQIQKKRDIKVGPNNELIFEDTSIKLPKDTPTAWSRKDGKGHYNLGALWFYLANKDLKQSDYVK